MISPRGYCSAVRRNMHCGRGGARLVTTNPPAWMHSKPTALLRITEQVLRRADSAKISAPLQLPPTLGTGPEVETTTHPRYRPRVSNVSDGLQWRGRHSPCRAPSVPNFYCATRLAENGERLAHLCAAQQKQRNWHRSLSVIYR